MSSHNPTAPKKYKRQWPYFMYTAIEKSTGEQYCWSNSGACIIVERPDGPNTTIRFGPRETEWNAERFYPRSESLHKS